MLPVPAPGQTAYSFFTRNRTALLSGAVLCRILAVPFQRLTRTAGEGQQGIGNGFLLCQNPFGCVQFCRGGFGRFRRGNLGGSFCLQCFQAVLFDMFCSVKSASSLHHALSKL